MAGLVDSDSMKARRVAVAKYLAEEGERDRAVARESGRVVSSGIGPSGRSCLFIRKGRKMVNQDAALLWESFGGHEGATLLAVMDGHGAMGERISARARDSLPSLLLAALREARETQVQVQAPVVPGRPSTDGVQRYGSDPSFRQWEGVTPPGSNPVLSPGPPMSQSSGEPPRPGSGPFPSAPPTAVPLTESSAPVGVAQESREEESFSLMPVGKTPAEPGEELEQTTGTAVAEETAVEQTESSRGAEGPAEGGKKSEEGTEEDKGEELSQPGCLPLRSLSRKLRLQPKPVHPEGEGKKDASKAQAQGVELQPTTTAPPPLAHAMLSRTDWEKVFEACNREIRLHPNINPMYSGSTAVVALLQGNRLTVAHVGDSRAVLGVRGPSGALRPIQLTRDHKARDEAEKGRVERGGGRVFADPREPQTMRVWLPTENIPGLAVTRALGDEVLKAYGVSHAPDVLQVDLDDSAEVLILASDGVWDKVSNEEALMEATEKAAGSCSGRLFVGRETAAKRICDLATSRWGYKTRDDISVVVARLGPDVRSQPVGCM